VRQGRLPRPADPPGGPPALPSRGVVDAAGARDREALRGTRALGLGLPAEMTLVRLAEGEAMTLEHAVDHAPGDQE
jgi:hypothetical protein